MVAMLNMAQADVIWVGLSTPKQERWMAEHVGRLQAPVLIGVGAAFDFTPASNHKRRVGCSAAAWNGCLDW